MFNSYQFILLYIVMKIALGFGQSTTKVISGGSKHQMENLVELVNNQMLDVTW